MTKKSFSVRIYLQDGHASGVKMISKSKWSGRGLVIPRTSLQAEIGRDELNAPGVFVLIDPGKKGVQPSVCIGSADPVCDPLGECDLNTESWTEVIVFASKDNTLTRKHVQYLEARLIECAQQAKQAILQNKNSPHLPSLSAVELVCAEAFLNHMLSLYPLLGVSAFEAI